MIQKRYERLQLDWGNFERLTKNISQDIIAYKNLGSSLIKQINDIIKGHMG